MKLEIKIKKDNPLLNRMEILAEIEHENEPTPTRESIKESLALKLDVEKDLIVIKKLDSQFGPRTNCEAVVYKNKEDLKKTEHQHILKRGVKEAPTEQPSEAQEQSSEPQTSEGGSTEPKEVEDGTG